VKALVVALLLLLLSTYQASAQVALLVPEVIAIYPTDPEAFTQGLLFHDGRLLESTGLYGRSSLREADPTTGRVLRRVALEERFFGEGLALVGDRLIQLTWREQIALVYDLATFTELERWSYEGEGWGLCFDGTALFRSDGSSTITLHDPGTFAVKGTLPVTRHGRPVPLLNELECVGGKLYANVFLTDMIVVIDARSGIVTAQIDARALTRASGRPLLPDAVLNGIAYDPDEGVFYLTGKLWPTMFKVRFVPSER